MFEKQVCGTCNYFPDCRTNICSSKDSPCTGIGGVKWEKLNNKPIKKERALIACDLSRKGGKWLGAARSWLQSNTNNGDRVTWGSHDILEPHLTVRQMEDFAAHVAAAAINEDRKKRQGETK